MSKTDAPRRPAPVPIFFAHCGVRWGVRPAPGYPNHISETVRSAETDVYHARMCEAVAAGRLEAIAPPIAPEDVQHLTTQEAMAWYHLVTAMLRAPVTVTLPPLWSDALLVAVARALVDRGDLTKVPQGR